MLTSFLPQASVLTTDLSLVDVIGFRTLWDHWYNR